MSAQIRRRGRHQAGYKLSKRMRQAGSGLAWLLALAAVFLVGAIAQPVPSQASPVHRVYVLRYVPHTILCHPWQAGADGLVYGDGKPFQVVCEPIHPPRLYGWDEENWRN